jgi:hypothetical protein
MKTRLGCLTLLALSTIAAAVFVWTTRDPPDTGAAIPILGVMALGIIYIGSAVERLTTRTRREPRGFPVGPPPRPDGTKTREADEPGGP